MTSAAGEILIRRRGLPTKPYCTVRAGGRDSLASFYVWPGDSIYVDKANIVYVMGEVIRPGGYRVSQDGMSPQKAIAMAYGLINSNEVGSAWVLRKNNGSVEELGPIVKGAKQQSLSPEILLPEDILYIEGKHEKKGPNFYVVRLNALSSTVY